MITIEGHPSILGGRPLPEGAQTSQQQPHSPHPVRSHGQQIRVNKNNEESPHVPFMNMLIVPHFKLRIGQIFKEGWTDDLTHCLPAAPVILTSGKQGGDLLTEIAFSSSVRWYSAMISTPSPTDITAGARMKTALKFPVQGPAFGRQEGAGMSATKL